MVDTSAGDLTGAGASAVLEEVGEKMAVCEILMSFIREKNKGCRIFRVEVDVQGESGSDSDSESEDTDVEDISDGSWEEIGEDDIMASVGVE